MLPHANWTFIKKKMMATGTALDSSKKIMTKTDTVKDNGITFNPSHKFEAHVRKKLIKPIL